MAEEVKTNQDGQGAEAPAGPKKPKKINKLTSDELSKKMKSLDETNLSQSVYYKHLIHRKKELETTQQ